MKRTPIVVAIALLVIAVAALPAGIGWLVERQTMSMIESRVADEGVQWNRGWFRSGVRIDAADLSADFDFRHLTLSPPGWLEVDGRIIVRRPPASIDVDGHVRPGLNGEFSAHAPSLAVGEGVVGRYVQPRVHLRAGDDRLSATAQADAVSADDRLGNRLRLEGFAAEAGIEESDAGRVAIRLEVSGARPGLPASRLSLRMEEIEPAALETFAQAVVELVSAEPGSTTATLAAIGAASAWQQLGARGMTVTLESLELDGDFSLQGRWLPGEGRFSLVGGGSRETLTAWAAIVTGLVTARPPASARAEVFDRLEDLARREGIALDASRLEISLDRLPALRSDHRPAPF